MAGKNACPPWGVYMDIIIQCPACHRRLRVPPALVGQDAQCPTCQRTFVATEDAGMVPRPATAPDKETFDLRPAENVPNPRPTRKPVAWDDDDDGDEYDRPRRRSRDGAKGMI